jgi:lia operon protein LiaG
MVSRTLLAAALAAPGVALAQEEVRPGQAATLAGRVIEIYNVSGYVTLRRGSGSTVTVRPTAQGADGSQLQFFVDRTGESAVFRVQYPRDMDALANPEKSRGSRARGSGGRTNVRLRDDGTFGGDNFPRRRSGGRDITIGGRDGLRAWADLEIAVPANTRLVLHLVAGEVLAEGVEGSVVIDTWSASAVATNIGGDWLFDTGSGDVEVTGARGTLRIHTGSSAGIVAGMRGDVLDVHTGSGTVEVSDTQVERCRFDTGSGDVRATGLTARRCVADTGSGSVQLDYTGGTIDDLVIDTGSGSASVTLPPNPDVRITVDVGSGGINVHRAGGMLEHRSRNELSMRFGEGRERVRIDTGSGSVNIR